jgi:DNA-binding beta-propeller fold protein YncE
VSGKGRSLLAAAVAVLLLGIGGWLILRRERERASKEHYQYDLESLRGAGAELVRYRETARLPTGLTVPRGIAVARDGRIVVAGDSQVVILSAEGKRLGGFAVKGEPGPLAVSGGEVFLGFGDHLEVYSLAGESKGSWTSLGEKAVITSVAVDGEDVFIADYGNRAVWRFGRGGALKARIGEKDPAKGVHGFIVPSPHFDVAVDPKAGVWVANVGRRKLELYDRSGALVRSWGKASVGIEGFSGCCNPAHVTLLPDGSVVTSEKGLVRIKVYGGKGELRSVVALPAHFGKASLPLDVACDAKGRILALDSPGKLVRVFEKVGRKAK